MIAARPWLGFGFEGFQDFCGQTQFWHGWPALGIPDAENGGIKACNLHPHNYYLQLGTMAGLPGLALFVALVVTWLRRMAAALRPGADGVQATLASTSGLFTLDTAGWVFLITGWGLAASRRAE
jgi:O-antigen ligase